MPHNAARCRNAILRCRIFASAKGMLAGIAADGTKIPSDGTKIPSDEKKIPSDETKILSDVLTTPPRGNDASNRIHFFVKL